MADDRGGPRARPAHAERVRRAAWAGYLILGLTGLVPSAQAVEHHDGQVVMGTILEVTTVASTPERAAAASAEAIATARHWDDVLTTWRDDGELFRFNARSGEGFVSISRDLERALAQMRWLATVTGHAFDPTVGARVRAARDRRPPPTVVHRISESLALQGGRARLLPDAEIDAGGIGKGIALDRAAVKLRAAGIDSAFLDFGGSTQLALGPPPSDAAGWKLAISGLREEVVHGIVRLRDGALSTSRSPGDPEVGLLIDPRTGAIVEERRMAVVRADDASAADAWSTALIVLGAAGLELLESRGLEALFEDEQGVRSTAHFWTDEPSPARGRSPSPRPGRLPTPIGN